MESKFTTIKDSRDILKKHLNEIQKNYDLGHDLTVDNYGGLYRKGVDNSITRIINPDTYLYQLEEKGKKNKIRERKRLKKRIKKVLPMAILSTALAAGAIFGLAALVKDGIENNKNKEKGGTPYETPFGIVYILDDEKGMTH